MEHWPKPEHLVSDKIKLEIFIVALRQLACLGNGKHLGNSDANIMAQRALARAGIDLIGDDPAKPIFTAAVNMAAKKPEIGNG